MLDPEKNVIERKGLCSASISDFPLRRLKTPMRRRFCDCKATHFNALWKCFGTAQSAGFSFPSPAHQLCFFSCRLRVGQRAPEERGYI